MKIKVFVPICAVGLLASLASVAGASASSQAPAASSTAGHNYLVVYKGSQSPADASASIANAGGTVVYDYRDIGVTVAKSDSASFGTTLSADSRVEGVVDTSGFGTRLDEDTFSGGSAPSGNAPVADADSLSGLQWDMVQIHTPAAHAITGGSP